MTQTNLNRKTILILLLTLKVVPLRWVYGLRKIMNFKQQKLINLVQNLVADGLAEIKETYQDERFIFLTSKGYSRASEIIPPNYSYSFWSKGANRTETIFRHHHYITFKFLIEYLSELDNNVDTISVDYDKNCKIGVKLGSHTYYVYPDLLIRPTPSENIVNNTLVAVESDTGFETIKKLFDKLLRYLILTNRDFDGDSIAVLKIYFVFNSLNRRDNVFGNEQNTGYLYPLFDQSTRTKFYIDKMPDSLGIKELFKVLDSGRIELYSGDTNQHLSTFRKEEIKNRILDTCPSVSELYKQIERSIILN